MTPSAPSVYSVTDGHSRWLIQRLYRPISHRTIITPEYVSVIPSGMTLLLFSQYNIWCIGLICWCWFNKISEKEVFFMFSDGAALAKQNPNWQYVKHVLLLMAPCHARHYSTSLVLSMTLWCLLRWDGLGRWTNFASKVTQFNARRHTETKHQQLRQEHACVLYPVSERAISRDAQIIPGCAVRGAETVTTSNPPSVKVASSYLFIALIQSYFWHSPTI